MAERGNVKENNLMIVGRVGRMKIGDSICVLEGGLREGNTRMIERGVRLLIVTSLIHVPVTRGEDSSH